MVDEQFKELLKKVEKMKKSGEIDLSMEEDLSVAVMNLISLEEHFFFTGSKTGKTEYYDFLNETRQIRKDLLGRLIDKKKHEGETWCISKHLLATTMRLIEVGTKFQQDGNKEQAQKIFAYAYKIYTLFWGLRLNLVAISDIKKTAQEEKPWSLKDIVNKLVDCCDE